MLEPSYLKMHGIIGLIGVEMSGMHGKLGAGIVNSAERSVFLYSSLKSIVISLHLPFLVCTLSMHLRDDVKHYLVREV